MKKFLNWQVGLGAGLLVLSAFVYFCHFLIFKDAHHIFIYLIGDIAFVFIEVFLVTLILHRLLSYQEKCRKMKKLNMVIGAFFSELGQDFLKILLSFDQERERLEKMLNFSIQTPDREFVASMNSLAQYEGELNLEEGDLLGMKNFLVSKKDFLLNLLSSANLLEHEAFSDLLWSIFHLTEELHFRAGFDALPESDRRHLLLDLQRVYCRLIREWLRYLRHLRAEYPYLFSLAIRINPFLPQRTAIVQS